MPSQRPRKAPAPARPSGPVSVNLPTALRRSIAREAERRGLAVSTTIRTLVGERLEEIAQQGALSRAEEWQRAQSWAAWDKLRAGDRREVGVADLDALFLPPARKQRRR